MQMSIVGNRGIILLTPTLWRVGRSNLQNWPPWPACWRPAQSKEQARGWTEQSNGNWQPYWSVRNSNNHFCVKVHVDYHDSWFEIMSCIALTYIMTLDLFLAAGLQWLWPAECVLLWQCHVQYRLGQSRQDSGLLNRPIWPLQRNNL